MEEYKKLANEALKLYLKIKQDSFKLKDMRRELLKKMSEYKTRKILLDEGQIKAVRWKSSFSNVLRQEFKKLDNKKKRELFKTGLLSVNFRLNTNKFQELKNKKEKTKLDEYVISRRNKLFLNFRLTDEILKKLGFKKEETIKPGLQKEERCNVCGCLLSSYHHERICSWEDDVNEYGESLEDLEDEEQEFWNEIAEEVEPDPIYFEDDDPDEMPEHEREYKGYD